MATGRTIIKRALQIAGIITKNEDPSADEISDGLESLNDMIASWSNDSLLVYARTWEDFTLSGGVGEYTIGSGGDFNTVRPVAIIEGHIKTANIKYTDLDIISDPLFRQLVTDYSLSGYPTHLNYDNAFPLGNIRLYPVPSGAFTMSLLSEKQITALTLDVEVALPPGWDRALKYNLAEEVVGEYGQELSAANSKIAASSLTLIKLNVAKNTTMDSQPNGSGSSFNIYRGW